MASMSCSSGPEPVRAYLPRKIASRLGDHGGSPSERDDHPVEVAADTRGASCERTHGTEKLDLGGLIRGGAAVGGRRVDRRHVVLAHSNLHVHLSAPTLALSASQQHNAGSWTRRGTDTMLVEVDPRLETARSLGLDHVAVEVSGALRRAGVAVVLLKGAALATWLYDDGGLRPYGDVDLLVAPGDHAKAERILVALGFGDKTPGLSALEQVRHARAWSRDGATVDLHRSLWGIGIDPALAWPVLSEGTETLRLGGGSVEILAAPARALHVALHAAQHGQSHSKPSRDVARAVARLPSGTWEEASAVARRLGAQEAMAAGLRLVPQGAELATRLGLPTGASLTVRARASSTTRGAIGLAEVIETPGFGAKVARTARLAVPSPAQVRLSLPFAGRSRSRLAVGYLWLPLLRASRLPRAALAVARIRRDTRRAGR